MSAKTSVVMRTKNRPLLLARAVDSVLSQTEGDFELLIVDDGDDPGIARGVVERSAAASDDRVRIVPNDGDPGRSGAINTGIAAATGEYFVLHDDDDSWDPRFLERTTAHLGQHPDDAAVAVRTEIVFEEIVGDRVVEGERQAFATDQSQVSLLSTIRQNYVPPIALLIRMRIVDELGGFDTELPVLEDWDYNLRILSRATIGFVDGEPLARWHHRRDSVGDDGNSVVAEAGSHADYNVLIRDLYLRRHLRGGGDLGPLLAVAEMFRVADEKAAAAWTDHTSHEHEWNLSHRGHLELVNANLSVELARLRGEVVLMREMLTEMKGRLDDVWLSSRTVARHVVEDGREHPLG